MTAIMVIVMVYQSAVTNEARARDELKQVNYCKFIIHIYAMGPL